MNDINKIMSNIPFTDNMSFVVMDCPTSDRMEIYLSGLTHFKIKHLVRADKGTYDTAMFEKNNIKCQDMYFKDGSYPPIEIIDQWLQLVQSALESDENIAVHCVAGLGRAPVLVALALIECNRMDSLDAIELVRKHRRGAFNSKQIQFLLKHKRKRGLFEKFKSFWRR